MSVNVEFSVLDMTCMGQMFSSTNTSADKATFQAERTSPEQYCCTSTYVFARRNTVLALDENTDMV